MTKEINAHWDYVTDPGHFAFGYIIDQDEIMVARPIGREPSKNARLIAAAPEMADMLKCFVDWLDAFGDEPDCDEIRALLAKIEGQNNG